MRHRTKLECKRRTAIIQILSSLSRNGWQNVRAVDYRQLEAELDDLDDKEDSQ